MSIVVRPAELGDVPGLARVHVEGWRETYRGQMPDEVLDDPTFVERRERFWTAVISDDRPGANRRAATAILDGKVVGAALAGAPTDDDATWPQQLYVLYTYAAVHGQGGGAALLAEVIDLDAPAALWVADPNPRAQAFYRKHGFEADGVSKVDDGVREIRMVSPSPLSRS
ncbi:GNAT family N-acetyltransferase [Gryllotalpicola daejeonensis]|uniref:GNAT family N-acetyltransferase n=1 Tax=Gryllotalpicola daejeonensis TaxID=993087 RepID=A0ABP7ZHU9_9MICO